MRTTDQLIDEIFEEVIKASGHMFGPVEDWETDDTITFGDWREAIRKVIDPQS